MIDEIKRAWWNEPLRMASLGVLSIAVVMGVRLMFVEKSADRPAGNARSITEIERRLDEMADHEKAMTRRLADLESAINDLQQRTKHADALVPKGIPFPEQMVVAASPTSTASGSETAQAALRRGWAYLAKGAFDPTVHTNLLSELVVAYAVRGLSAEVNTSLINAIQQVNEVGVNRVIGEAHSLPAPDAGQRLRTFLDTTPKLTPTQKQRLNAALTAAASGSPR